MNPSPLVTAYASERAAELARTAASRRAAVRRRSRSARRLEMPQVAVLRPARPGC